MLFVVLRSGMKLLCGYQAQLLGFLRCVHPSPSGCAAFPDVSSVIPILSLVRLRFRAWCDCVCGGGGARAVALGVDPKAKK